MTEQTAPVVKLTDARKVEQVCALVVNGGSLNKAVKEVFGDNRKFWEVITKNPDLRTMKDAALDIRADHLADEIVQIADTELDPQKARNMITSRTWLASKLKPRSYGERLELNVNQQISAIDALAEARTRAGIFSIHELQAMGSAKVVELVSGSKVQDAEIIPGPEPDIFT